MAKNDETPKEENATQLTFEGMVENSVEPATTLDDENDGVSLSGALSTYTSTGIDFDSEDVLIPRLRLAQGLTAEVQGGEVKPGQWIMTGWAASDELTIVPQLFAKRRELLTEDFHVKCRSRDSLIGEGEPGGVCAECPLSKWVPAETEGGKNSPPKCTFVYSYIVYIVEFQTIGMLEFKRTSLPSGKLLNTMIATRGLGNFAVRLRSQGNKGPRGQYFSALVQPAVVTKETLELASGLMA